MKAQPFRQISFQNRERASALLACRFSIALTWFSLQHWDFSIDCEMEVPVRLPYGGNYIFGRLSSSENETQIACTFRYWYELLP